MVDDKDLILYGFLLLADSLDLNAWEILSKEQQSRLDSMSETLRPRINDNKENENFVLQVIEVLKTL